MDDCLHYSHFVPSGSVSVTHNCQQNPEAFEVEKRPGEAITLDDLHLGEPSAQQGGAAVPPAAILQQLGSDRGQL